MTKFPELFAALTAPFHPDNLKQKTETSEKTGKSFTCDYVTARTIMNRLDDVLGPENWWDDYTPIEHGAICRLTIRLPDGQLLTKVDAGADATKLKDAGDADKGGIADALKRTAVKFGVGRYLYGDGMVTHASSSPPAGGLATASSLSPPLEGGPGGVASEGTNAVAPPARPGSQDAQGRGGASVYGQAGARPRTTDKPKTGEDLHYYALENKIDPGLSNWIVNSFNPQGWPDRIINWTPDEVRQALPSIREHLETVKQARARMKASV
jgi:Rad52/22 family double-strand break repair protein